jgi:hypothetical protein
MNFADTTTLAEIQIARAEQAPGWDAGDAHDLRVRSEQAPHQQAAEEIVVTTAADRLTDKLVRLTIAARAATIRWDRTEQSGGTGYDPLLAQAMEELAATLKEIGA